MTVQTATGVLLQAGLTPEEVQDLDIIRFVQDYEVDRREYSAEELRDILADEGAYYQDDGKTREFSILNEEGTASLRKDTVLTDVAYSYNNGTYYERGVIHLDDGYVCINTAEHITLRPDAASEIARMAADYELFAWEHDYRGEEAVSTGSLGWRLVFKTQDGEYCVYGGFTSDGSHLPDHFDEVIRLLRSAGHP